MAADLTNSPTHWLERRIASGTATATPAAIPDLVHSALSGTPDDTLADMTSSYSEAVAEANLKDIAVKVNTILAALRVLGVVAT